MDYIDRNGDGQGVFGSPLQSIMDTFILTLGEVNYDFESVSFVSIYSIIGEVSKILREINDTAFKNSQITFIQFF